MSTSDNPAWITKVDPEILRANQRAIEARQRAGETLPLAGRTFAAKDNIDVAGIPTTAGCPAFARTPSRSAPVIQRLEQAGALLLGKTNMDQFATGLVGTRSPYGACSSIFSPAHVSGGSSSGSAVAVALGEVDFALGTDTAGSGRVPAAFNNIVGLKPTRGLVSTRGVLPACQSLDCVSVFAGTVADAADILAVAAAHDPADPYSRAAQPRVFNTADFRFGVPIGINPEQGAALHEAAIARLQSLGGQAVPFDFAPFARAGALLYQGPWVAERLSALRDADFCQWNQMDPIVAGIISAAAGIDAAGAFAGLHALAQAAQDAAPCWAQFDVMLLPTAPFHPTHAQVAADPIATNARLGTYTNFVNLLDHCAAAIPAGIQPSGLPYGITLVGPAFTDAALAHLAARFHAAVPGATIGATGRPLPPRLPPESLSKTIELAVVGAHLAGQPLHDQLASRGARLVRATRTAAGYRLFALAGAGAGKPGLVRDPTGAGRIEVETYRLDPAAFGSFTNLVPAPLAIGTVILEDGSAVKGFVCEPAGMQGATDITQHGGWRAWLASQ